MGQGTDQPTPLTDARQFRTTHWSIVMVAGSESNEHADEAWEKLCRAYWRPLYAWVRHRGYSPENAEDLTQGFFEFLLDKNTLSQVRPGSGKFRSWLLTVFTNYINNQQSHDRAQKRGGGTPTLSIDDTAEVAYQRQMATSLTPEMLYDRQWALTVLEQAMNRMRQDYQALNKLDLFDSLQSCLPGAPGEISYPALASQCAMTESNVRMAMHRFRRRFRKILRAEIAATVSSSGEVDGELKYLIEILSRE